jgi:hypothetical protein
MRVETDENKKDAADKIKKTAVNGFMGTDPMTRFFKVILSICHPNKTKSGMIKTVQPNILEQFFRNSTLDFTPNLLPTSPRPIKPLNNFCYKLKGICNKITVNELIPNYKLEFGGFELEFGRVELENGV